MRPILFAVALSLLASCATPRAYSSSAGPQSTQTSSSTENAGSAGEGAGGGEPQNATYSPQAPFSNDYLENQRRAFEAWEVGG